MQTYRHNPWFYAPFILALLAGASILFFIEKGEEVLFINSLYSPFFDYLFYYGTSLGNGWMYVAVAVILLWKSYRHALLALVCFSVTGLVVQFLKNMIFPEMMRPSVVLSEFDLHFVEGVKIMKHFSFPSGHTATVFSLFCLLSLLVKRQWLGLIFIAMALIGGISRMYLVQHFFVDVYFGALIGVCITTLIFWMFHASPHFRNSTLLNQSLSSFFNRS